MVIVIVMTSLYLKESSHPLEEEDVIYRSLVSCCKTIFTNRSHFTCRNDFPVIFTFITYHCVCNYLE